MVRRYPPLLLLVEGDLLLEGNKATGAIVWGHSLQGTAQSFTFSSRFHCGSFTFLMSHFLFAVMQTWNSVIGWTSQRANRFGCPAFTLSGSSLTSWRLS